MAALPPTLRTLGEVSDTCTDIIMLLNTYFSSLTFTKIETKGGFVLYGACITSGLAGGYKRYVIALVPQVKAHLERGKLRELAWKVLQVRVLYQSYRLREQPWKLTREMGDMIIRNVSRDSKSSHYRPESCMKPGAIQPNYEIVLLHDPKKKTQYQYNNRMTLSAAVETFHMIFSILDHPQVPTSYESPQREEMHATPLQSYSAPEISGWDGNHSSSLNSYFTVTSQNHQLQSSIHPAESSMWYETSIPDPEEIDDSFERL